jgi:MFS transporter, DHA1 family, multidrug resistance protein
MIGWRIVQAVGACAGVVLARAMMRDLYEGERAAQMLSTLMTIMAIAPLVGPILAATNGSAVRREGGILRNIL